MSIICPVISFVIASGSATLFQYTIENGKFEVADLRIRYSLCARDASVETMPDGGFVLSAGGWCAVIKPAECSFNGEPITWCLGKTDGSVTVDGMIYNPRNGG